MEIYYIYSGLEDMQIGHLLINAWWQKNPKNGCSWYITKIESIPSRCLKLDSVPVGCHNLSSFCSWFVKLRHE